MSARTDRQTLISNAETLLVPLLVVALSWVVGTVL